MKIYEIDQAIHDLGAAYENLALEQESGQISLDQYIEREAEMTAKFEELEIAKEEKIAGVACLAKNFEAQAKAIKEERKMLESRQRVAENKVKHLQSFAAFLVGEGNKFEHPKCTISWRKSESVQIEDEGLVPFDFMLKVAPRIDKTAIKKALKAGGSVDGCALAQKQNIQIK